MLWEIRNMEDQEDSMAEEAWCSFNHRNMANFQEIRATIKVDSRRPTTHMETEEDHLCLIWDKTMVDMISILQPHRQIIAGELIILQTK